LPDPPALGLLDAPPEAGHDNREIDDLGFKLAPMGPSRG